MKQQLKYIKLFEAFESEKLSKTMRFVDKESKPKFLSVLSNIAEKIDFPMSKLNDSLFEYLPFKSALKKNVDPKKEEAEECNHESDWVPGEFCKGGMVKRTWGKGFRMITCPHCKGTGFKPIRKFQPELTYIKFWFDKDGKYITTTGTSGYVVTQSNSKDFGKKINQFPPKPLSFSDDFNDYDVLPQGLDFDETRSLPTGTFVKINLGESQDYIVGLIWHSNGKAYVLQNYQDGAHDSNNDEWKQYAQYSWCLGSSDDDMYGEAFVIEPKNKEFDLKPKEKEPEIDPYSINNLLNTRYLSLESYRDMEKRLSGSHFAIILNFKKMKSLEFERVADTKSKREESREGTLALQKPEDIKSANLKRYIQGLVNKFNIGNGLLEISKLIPRAFGWNNSITFVLRGINVDDLNYVIGDLYTFVKTDPSKRSDISYLEVRIKERIKNIYQRTGKVNQIVNNNTQDAFKRFDEMGNIDRWKEYQPKMVLIFEKYLKLGEILNQKLSSMPCETIGDLELIFQKIQSIKRVYDSGRLEDLRRLRYPIEYMTNLESHYNIADEISEIYVGQHDDILRELDEFKKIIERV